MGGGQPVVLALASQVAYLRTVASLTTLALPGAADRAQDQTAALRVRIAERLSQGDVDAELAMLGPLFEEHDPALVAGALLALQREQGAGSREQKAPTPAVQSGWVKVFVSVGKKEGAGAKDLVGALIREVGLDKAQIGKVDVKETFSLVEVASQVAENAVRRLTGVSIRGRRVAARLDRAG
jgi:ATP-dependent RNA helicase DeaD